MMDDSNQFPESSSGHPASPARQSPWRIANLKAALKFLFPLSRKENLDPGIARLDFVPYVVPAGLIVGLIWVGVFRLGWWLYAETGSLRLVPALMVILVECLVTGPFLALGLARTIHILTGNEPRVPGNDRLTPLSPVGTLMLCLIVLSEFVLILSIEHREGWWPPPDDWRSYFNFMYPRPIFRPLLLAPLWGRWGILLAATIGRTDRNADAQTLALNRGMSPGRLLRNALLPVVLTAIYCSRSRNFLTGVLIGMIVFALTYLVTVAMARRGGGQSRQSLFAAGQVAQLAFLAVYKGCWRLIDA